MDKSGGKRKGGGGTADGKMLKKRKVGGGGKWQTPMQKARAEDYAARGQKIEPGDVGIWITCVKGKEGKSTGEVRDLFNEFAEKLYDIRPDGQEVNEPDENEPDVEDIEAQIKKELESANKSQAGKERIFTPVRLEIACVLFFKIKPPVEPVSFVLEICKAAAANPAIRQHRFLNRLTPVSMIDKATEKGLEEVAQKVLKEHFSLVGDEEKTDEEATGFSYSIRPNIRNHNKILSRDLVIKQVARMIKSDKHKVDLTNPDKVVVVEVFQNVCGVSVIPGPEYEGFKRLNINEIYNAAVESKSQNKEAEIVDEETKPSNE